jgi:hypothetical protein
VRQQRQKSIYCQLSWFQNEEFNHEKDERHEKDHLFRVCEPSVRRAFRGQKISILELAQLYGPVR